MSFKDFEIAKDHSMLVNDNSGSLLIQAYRKVQWLTVAQRCHGIMGLHTPVFCIDGPTELCKMYLG